MTVDPNIQQKADYIRTRKQGSEVRESLASGLEAMSSDVVENKNRQNTVEEQFQQVIEETTDKDVISAPEIIAARNGEPNLKSRLDKEKQEVTAQLAQKPSYVVASNFDGVSAQKIQNALDYAETIPLNETELGQRVVYVDSQFYETDVPLRIGDNTTLFLNGTQLKIKDGVRKRAFENKNKDETGNHDIHIVGSGDVMIDCNLYGQGYTNLNNTANVWGIHFYNVTNFSIKGLRMKDTIRQVIVLERVYNGFIDDIYMDTQGQTNQDGVHITGPAKNITVNNVRGILGDDACVVNASANPAVGQGTGGNIENVLFNNINVKGGDGSHMGLLRTASSEQYKIDGVTISNSMGENVREALLRIGGGQSSVLGNTKNIVASNLIGKSGSSGGIALAHQTVPVENLNISGVTIETELSELYRNRGRVVDGLTINNVIHVVKGMAGTRLTALIELINTNIKDVTISNIVHKSENGESTAIRLLNLAGATVDNVNVSNVNAKPIDRYMISDTASVFKNVRLSEIVLSGYSADAFSGAGGRDVIVNNFAQETGDDTSNTPMRTSYQMGDSVLYRRSPAHPYAMFIKDHGGQWRKLYDEST